MKSRLILKVICKCCIRDVLTGPNHHVHTAPADFVPQMKVPGKLKAHFSPDSFVASLSSHSTARFKSNHCFSAALLTVSPLLVRIFDHFGALEK